jgi:hypothetical protein
MLKVLYTDSKQFFKDVFDVGIYLYSQSLNGSEQKRYQDACNFLGITQTNIKSALENGRSVFYKYPGKHATVGIEKDMLFSYYKNEKTEFEIACLGAFLGIKSILGTKASCKTNKAHIHARKFGYNTVKDLPEKLSSLQQKYQIRWHMDKILIELQTDWFLRTISNHQRGMYISFDLTLDELAVKSEEIKKKTKIQQLRVQKKSAIDRAKILLSVK